MQILSVGFKDLIQKIVVQSEPRKISAYAMLLFIVICIFIASAMFPSLWHVCCLWNAVNWSASRIVVHKSWNRTASDVPMLLFTY